VELLHPLSGVEAQEVRRLSEGPERKLRYGKKGAGCTRGSPYRRWRLASQQEGAK
jgi:hypothetical protein